MKIGLQTYLGGESAEPEFLGRAAQAIEAGGFHSIWAPEHVVLFPELLSKYPYSVDGNFPFDTTKLPMEPFTFLAFLAAVTKRVRLGTGICILPQRNPVYTAKQAADVDVLSGGRLDVGLGVGWLREEYEALDVPFERRGARAADYVQVMQALWTQELCSFDGEFYVLPPCHQSPKPVQKPHPPIYFGGESEAAMTRVARFGQGWFAAGTAPDALAAKLPRLAELLAAQGRSRRDVTVIVGPKDGKATLDDVKRYRDLGVDQVILALTGRNLERFLGRLEVMVENVVRPAAAL